MFKVKADVAEMELHLASTGVRGVT